MAISNYSELKTAIAAWDDLDSSLDAQMDDILIMANDSLNNGLDMGMAAIPALRVREMEAVEPLTPANGVYTLPADYLQYRRVVEVAGLRRPLSYVTPDDVDQKYPMRSGGLSNNFTIIGGSLYTFPLSSNNVELTYYQAIPDITASDTTNWLLTKRPAIYLHASLFQVGIIRRDDGLMQRSAQMVAALTNAMMGNDEMANYAYAPVQMRGMTVA